ncbi:MAG: MATE family efflux transporter [Lachnospiraceae bacterium]|nr:MATE family efflux transporter [Lachnospiraceae bacterium]
MEASKNDFSKGSVVGNILGMAVPMTLAQLINVLYNVVDRVYIGYIPEHATLSLTGLGVCLPVITAAIAFANLFGMGGAPLCSIERGKGNEKEAEAIMGNSFTLLVLCGLLLTAFGLIFKRQLLYLFGASDITYPYADSYMTIYLLGSVFVMIGLGMNSFINSQGFAKIGMKTVLLGAFANIILDPVFIFGFHMDVQGAALATVISQFLSAAWALRFLTGDGAILRLKKETLGLSRVRVVKITSMGMSSFMAGFTNSLVAVACNATLQTWGGDLYVGVMTVIHSVREIVENLIKGLTSGSQPVLGFNYGAKQYRRVRQAIKFVSVSAISFTFVCWVLISLFPETFIHIFNRDETLVQAAIPCLRIYFFGFFMMSLQYAGQCSFVGLGKAKQATFFSIFRKVIIVLPLTILLPHVGGLGVMGVFLAEPVSNFMGGGACYLTMLRTVWPELDEKKTEKARNGEIS